MPDGGRLTIATAHASTSMPTPARPDTAAGRLCRVRVADTGEGMAPESPGQGVRPVLHHQADRPGHRPRPVHGLGFARQTGGHVRIESRSATGTAVILYLPRLRGPEPVAIIGSAADGRRAPSPGRPSWSSRTRPIGAQSRRRGAGRAGLRAPRSAGCRQRNAASSKAGERIDLLSATSGCRASTGAIWPTPPGASAGSAGPVHHRLCPERRRARGLPRGRHGPIIKPFALDELAAGSGR